MISKNSLSDSEQFTARQDERTGLKALFERVFFDVPYRPDAVRSLERTAFIASEAAGEGARAFEDSPRTVLLYRGESGVGKTRIFRQFRNYAEERRIPVYEIHCYDVEGIPFKPFLRVIREILRDFEFGDMLREKYRPGLEALLPEIFRRDSSERGGAGALPDWGVRREWEKDKLRIFDGITQLLFEITALRPVVILVHDINWGDHATIELLRFLGRNIRLRNARFDAWRRPDEEPLEEPEWRDSAEPEEDSDLEGGDGGAPADLAGVATAELQEGRGPAGAIEDRPVRMMVLANYQGSSDADEPIERALRSLGDEPFVYHGEIRRLSLEETRRFVRHLTREAGADIEVSDEIVSRVHNLTEGFPGYVQELVRLLAPSGPSAESLSLESLDRLADASRLRTEPSPEAAAEPAESTGDGDETEGAEGDRSEKAPSPPAQPRRFEILRRRMLGVSQDELAVARALALARKPLTAPYLSRVLSLKLEDVQALLSGLERGCFLERVVQLFPSGGQEDGFYFRIWDYAAIVSEGIASDDERAELHQKIGEEVRQAVREGRAERSFEVFYHLRRGRDSRAAVEYGWLAADRFARSFAMEKAALLLSELLGLLGESEDLPTRLEILERRATYQLALEDFAGAEASLHQLYEEADSDLEGPRHAELLIHEGEVHRLAGDTNRALKVLTRAFKFVGDINSPLGVRWHLEMARVRRDRADYKRGTNLCLKGIKIAQKLLADGAASEGDAGAGEAGDGRAERDSALRLLARVSRVLAQTFARRGDSVHAVENFRRALDGFEQLGDEKAAAKILDDLGNVYLEQGTYFRAARYFYRALEIKRRNQDIAGLCQSYDQLGMVYLRTGDEFKTIAHLRHSIYLKEKIGDLRGLNPTLGVMGELSMRLGRYAKALRFFDKEIHNAELIKDTQGLVDAFVRKGWLYHEIGDDRQVDRLTRQTGILATEFKLRLQEASSARLRGAYEALRRNWNEAEAQLKRALEISSKLGNRRQEAKVLLDQAEVRYEREAYDEALKLASKATVLADQLKAVDLQARAHVIKGNVFRFLKGGNMEKAREHLDAAMALGETINDVHLLFVLFYSQAKLHHYGRDFLEAGNYYARAEAVLRRIADELPDDLSARYFEDGRRKVFLDDANRFRREVQGRTAPEGATLFGAPVERSVGITDFKELNSSILRLNGSQNRTDFHDAALAEALELARCERGFILRVRNRQYALVTQRGFGDVPEQNTEFASAQSVAEESIRKGKSFLVTDSEDKEKDEQLGDPRGLFDRSVLVVPLRTNDRIFGSLYVDRPVSVGVLSQADLQLLEGYAEHVGVAFDNRRVLELAVREPLTGLSTTSYFLERLREAYRLNNLHGRPFFLLGFYLPTLEASLKDEARLLGERLAAELREELPVGAPASWGSPILTVLVSDMNLPATDALAQRIETRLIALVNGKVSYEILAPEARIPNGVSLYYELRRKLLPEEGDQHTLLEIRQLLSRDITLKDAKRILEKHIIENTLRKTGGNITHAAKELGIHRPQLSSLLKKHDLKRERFEPGMDVEFDEETDRLRASEDAGTS